jgi:hypothetical protein
MTGSGRLRKRRVTPDIWKGVGLEKGIEPVDRVRTEERVSPGHHIHNWPLATAAAINVAVVVVI